ncbi:MAG: sulfurtransferase [Acidobacteria bacterium]|nr:sulfurtransferase [Acidobacteriota bacterium]
MTAEWLEQHREDPRVVIVDARPEAEYAKGHIPAAILINAYDYMVDSTPEGERAFHGWLAETFSRAGIGPRDQVIIYENKLGMRAARAYWMLRYAGHSNASLLEGGLEAWRGKQLPVSTAPPAPRPATHVRVRPQKQWMATAQEIAAELKDPRVMILDVRTRGEYDGKSGSADCARQGRIPGAVWIEWTHFMTADSSSFDSTEKLRALLSQNGITPDKQIVTYCHRGARAAAAWAALENLGFRHLKNYAGSWHDWAAKKDLPAE